MEFIIIICCGILSFLFSIIYSITTKVKNSILIKKNYIYIWALVVLIIALAYPDSLIRKTSLVFLNDSQFLGEILKIAIFACVLGCVSGYKTISKKFDFDFCIIFPIFEEILFRGVILLLFINVGLLSNKTAIILSALLFGVMHFQYFGFKISTLRYVLFALIGGYFFADIALKANSIIPTIFLHMIFNSSAIMFSKYKSKK